jgi:NADP-dependent 3-hydroxy acid dehydrogenase YdfG
MDKPVVLIRDAGSPFGRATAFAFADSGARIVVTDCRESEAKALTAELQELGVDAVFAPAKAGISKLANIEDC